MVIIGGGHRNEWIHAEKEPQFEMPDDILPDLSEEEMWTTEQPTKPGVYWFEGEAGVEHGNNDWQWYRVGPTIAELSVTRTWRVFGDKSYRIRDIRGRWAGPIVPPTYADSNS